MGNRSALLYKYEVCHRIGYDAVIRDDYDAFFNQFDDGRIRTQHIDTIRNNIERAGLYAEEEARDNCFIFKLTKTYTSAEMEALYDEERKWRARVNEIVKVKVLDPIVMSRLVEASGRLHQICLKKMDKVSRDTNGVRIVNLCDQAIRTYYEMAEKTDATTKEIGESWRELRKVVHMVMIELQMVVDLRIWRRTQTISLGETLNSIEERLDTHIRKTEEKLKKEEKDQEKKEKEKETKTKAKK